VYDGDEGVLKNSTFPTIRLYEGVTEVDGGTTSKARLIFRRLPEMEVFVMHRLVVPLIAASVVLAPIAGTAAQPEMRQTPGSNITIYACDPHVHVQGVSHPWVDPYGTLHQPTHFPNDEGFLTIDYLNDAKKTATEVDFGLVIRDSLVATATDKGTFSSGIKIQHEFVISREVFPIGTSEPYCPVLRVKYSDGSEWRNPIPPPT